MIEAEDEELNEEEAVELQSPVNQSNVFVVGIVILIGVIIYLIGYIKRLKSAQD